MPFSSHAGKARHDVEWALRRSPRWTWLAADEIALDEVERIAIGSNARGHSKSLENPNLRGGIALRDIGTTLADADFSVVNVEIAIGSGATGTS